MPRELGGGGAEVAELADMLRILAHSCSSTALAFAMHTHQVAIPAWRWRHQKVAAVEPLLKRVANDRIILLTSGGSDWIGGSGKAEKVEGGYRISARKVFTSAAAAGDVLMTGAVLHAEGEPDTVIHFPVPMKAPEVKILDTWKTLGMRGTRSDDVLIDGLFVPDASVGFSRRAGEWHPVFQIIATVAFPLIYAAYLGVAESARDIALGLAKRKGPTHDMINLAGRMDTALRAAQLAHQWMVKTTERNEPSADTVNEMMIGRSLVAKQRDQDGRARHGACRRRRLLPRQRARAALQGHPGRALPSDAGRRAGVLCRRHGARHAGDERLLNARCCGARSQGGLRRALAGRHLSKIRKAA